VTLVTGPPATVKGVLRSIGQRLRHPRPWMLDGGIALALLGLMTALLAIQRPQAGEQPATPVAYLLVVLLTAPLVTHRRFPRTSLAICLAALILYAPGHFTAYPGLPIVALVCGISLHGSRRLALVAVIAAAAAMALSLGLQPPGVVSEGSWISSELGIVVAWLAGENLRSRRARWAELQARAERLERERQAEARRAVTEERLRIARELHDIVAHSMSVIAVQSAVGHHVMDTQPDQARHALAAIETTSRSAMTEMRRLLGILRRDGEPAGSLVPAPGLADLAPLIAQVREAGLGVWVHVEGEPAPVPPGEDMSAYRIVQEALTNVIKHAGSSNATVTVRYSTDSVTLEIINDGTSKPAAGAHVGTVSAGQGIIGMRERVAMFGGEFAAGPRPEGGFRVFACLPISEVTEVTS
jgi:signal transduction histidine kinase